MWISMIEQEETANELMVQRGQRRLKEYRRLRGAYDDTLLLKLAALVEKNRESRDLSDDYKATMKDIEIDIRREMEGPPEFDGITFPTEDQVEIVRCVHEGICPMCGRQAQVVEWQRVKVEQTFQDPFSGEWVNEYVDLPRHDARVQTIVECGVGHRALAEPTYHDWTGWIEVQHFTGLTLLCAKGAAKALSND